MLLTTQNIIDGTLITFVILPIINIYLSSGDYNILLVIIYNIIFIGIYILLSYILIKNSKCYINKLCNNNKENDSYIESKNIIFNTVKWILLRILIIGVILNIYITFTFIIKKNLKKLEKNIYYFLFSIIIIKLLMLLIFIINCNDNEFNCNLNNNTKEYTSDVTNFQKNIAKLYNNLNILIFNIWIIITGILLYYINFVYILKN
jgi:hypothetical protein